MLAFLRHVTIYAATAALLATGCLQAQTRTVLTLTVNDRLRYTLNNREKDRFIGILGAATTDSLYLRTEADTTLVSLALNRLIRLEVAVGQETHVRRDAVIFGALGAIGGGIFVAVRPTQLRTRPCPAAVIHEICYDPAPNKHVVAGVGAAALAGVVLGAGVGIFHRSDHWIAVDFRAEASR